MFYNFTFSDIIMQLSQIIELFYSFLYEKNWLVVTSSWQQDY